jgi:acetolactate synthase-1/2/3 large subunit
VLIKRIKVNVMNGAESLVRTLINHNVKVCFANPGTSEMHFLAALDRVEGMRSVLGLHESVVTGAADGYYRVKGEPACTLLHLAPGLANGLSNLHNARKAQSGIVNIVGQHATYHLQYDAPLMGDIEGVAKPLSDWVKTTKDPLQASADVAQAIHVAKRGAGKIATLILPADVSWSLASEVSNQIPNQTLDSVPQKQVDQVAQTLLGRGIKVLLLGGKGLQGRALLLAGQIAAKTGCRIMCEGHNARVERGAGRVNLERLPYDVPSAMAVLKDIDQLILVGSKEPVGFFAYPSLPSLLAPNTCKVSKLVDADEDVGAALETLANDLNALNTPAIVAQLDLPKIPEGKVTSEGIGAVLGACIPENGIVVDESISVGRGFFPPTIGAKPHDWMNSMGGSLGYALPVSIGAAIAAPDRKVLAISGDGSAMYSLQAMWTIARENLNVTIVILANRSYNILRSELNKVGLEKPGKTALEMLSLDNPKLDWVALSNGHGIEASRANTLEDFANQLKAALDINGPRLIELVI